MDNWRKHGRNVGIHDGLKSLPGDMLKPFSVTKDENRKAAEEAVMLAHALRRWLDRVKYSVEKKEGKTLPNSRFK